MLLIAITAALCFLPLVSDSESDADVGSAVIGSTHYDTVKDALTASVAGDVVFVIPDSDKQSSLGSDAVVKKGVTMVLPYSEDLNASGTKDGDDKASAKIANNNYRYMVFTVESGATLSVEGKLIVGGILSKFFTFDYQGHTSGDFARMQIKGTVSVESGGSLYCYGSVMGSGTLSLKDGAEAYEPFIVTDYVGGDLAAVSYNQGQSPFNRYAVENVQSKFTMTSGAKLYGLMNLFANGKYNKVVEPLVSDTEGLIILSKGSVLSSYYRLSEYLDANWESNIFKDVGKKYITVTGGATFGSISPEVEGRQADTGSTIFSIPYNFDVTLKDGTYSIGNKVRLLPGSSLTVAKGATLNVTGMLLAYNGLFDKVFRDKYYPTTEILGGVDYYSKIAELVVNGTMNVTGTFAGFVQSTAAGGVVSLDSKAKLSLKSQQYGVAGSIQGKSVDNVSRMDLRAFAMDGYGNEFDLVAGKTYTSSDKASHTMKSYTCYDPNTNKLTTIALDQAVSGSWYIGTLSVKYSANGGTGTVPTDVKRYQSGETAYVLGQGSISKDGYRFTGWATNSKGTGTVYTQGQAIKVTSSVTLYAVWASSGADTGVSLDKTSATIDAGSSITLKATVQPSTAANKSVVWKSSDPKVASVSNGKVTGASEGTATITVTTVDGGCTATCKVTVKGSVSVTGVSLDKTSATIDVGGSITLKATVKPSDATDKSVVWTSSSSKVASVSNGKVTGVSAGKATITVTTVDGGYKATCEVTVKDSTVSVTGVSLSSKDATVKEDVNIELKATVTPSNATNKNVSWSSDNASVASVSNGIVTGKSVGTANITVTTADGGFKATCKVTVVSPVVKVTGVDIKPDKETVSKGGVVVLAFEVLPSDASDKDVSWKSSNASVVTVSHGAVTGVSVGTAVITVTTHDGGFTDTCTIVVSEDVVETTGVVLSRNEVSLDVGSEAVLAATVFPSNATNKSVLWYSHDMSVVTVDGNGVLHGINPGKTVVTVSTADGKHTDKCMVTVNKAVVPVSSVTFPVSPVTLEVGDQMTLGYEVSPADATWSSVEWSSSDSSIAFVKDGEVTGLAVGTATITVSLDGVKGSCEVRVVEDEVSVEGVSLDRREATVNIGGTFQLEATVKPSDATDKSVVWTTSDSRIAVVSDGTVTALTEGTATITVMTIDGGFSDTCSLTVVDNTVHVTGVKLDKTYASFALGDTLVLAATVEPSDATDKTVFWTTSNSGIALVDNGTVTGVATGSAVITVTTTDGSFSAQCNVDVLPSVIHVTGVKLDKTSMTLTTGDVVNLKATVDPSEASDRSVRWSTSDSTIVKVVDGTVQAITAGTATVTVTTVDGGFIDSCRITVESPSAGGDNTLLYIAIGAVAVIGIVAAALVMRRMSA